jgi:hypothetical protein
MQPVFHLFLLNTLTTEFFLQIECWKILLIQFVEVLHVFWHVKTTYFFNKIWYIDTLRNNFWPPLPTWPATFILFYFLIEKKNPKAR